MVVSSNYAKNYASIIYKILLTWLVLLGDIVSIQNAATQFVAVYWRVLSGIFSTHFFCKKYYLSSSLKLSLSPLDTPSWRTNGKDAQRRMRRKAEKSYLWGSIPLFVCSLEDTHTNKYKQLDMFLCEEPFCNAAKKITQFPPSHLLTSSACSIV